MYILLLVVIYLAFISLGLPDALLGASWPLIYPSFKIPVSYAGSLAMLISLGTIIASFQSDRLTGKLGTVKVTFYSILLTALGLFGFAFSRNFYHLILATIPYGLGAGSIDAALNNYVALHYKSAHMSWLHCMWGVGASTGPIILALALQKQYTWSSGYIWIAYIQLFLAMAVALSAPLWHVNKAKSTIDKTADMVSEAKTKSLSLKEVWQLLGAKATLTTFFCYSAMEHCTGLWASSYLVIHLGLDANLAASYASRFFLGITVGRFISGFISFKLNDKELIRLGQTIVALGLIILCLANSATFALIALTIIGLGCAPIYPAIIHSTPTNFGKERSQALIGLEMGCAYIGSCLMPPVFGQITRFISISLYPYFLAAFLIIMIFAHEKLVKQLD